MKELIIIRGLPGSGKTTFATKLYNLTCPEAEMIAADDYFMVNGEYKWDPTRIRQAHENCQQRVQLAMGSEIPWVIVHNTCTTQKELDPYLNMAKEFGYRITSVIVENRHSGKSIHKVPEETINKMILRFEIEL